MRGCTAPYFLGFAEAVLAYMVRTYESEYGDINTDEEKKKTRKEI